MSELTYTPWLVVANLDVPVPEAEPVYDFNFIRVPWAAAESAEGVLTTARVLVEVTKSQLGIVPNESYRFPNRG